MAKIFEEIDRLIERTREPVFATIDLASLLNVGPSTVRYWVARGWLQCRDFGHFYIFLWSDVERFLQTYGPKLRCKLPKSLREVVPEQLWPENLAKRIELEHFKENYERWLFRALISLKNVKADAAHELTEEELARLSGVSLPENFRRIREENPELYASIRAESFRKVLALLKRYRRASCCSM